MRRNNLNKNNHIAHVKPVDDYLNNIIKEGKTFNHIICDPPSSSTDGKKTSAALKNYQNLLPKLCKSLSPGGNLYLFLNTHQVTWKKFENEITKTLKELPLERIKRLSPTEDAKKLKGFMEGDYLKGLLIKKV